MIEFVKGNIFDSETEAIVNAVNTVGIMGKGIALEFKKRYPENFKVYKNACETGTLKTGSVLVVKEYDGKIIINFPTKAHWKDASKLKYIIDGLESLKSMVLNQNIKSLALPAIGCGLGGLKWEVVKELIKKDLSHLDANIFVYEPRD